MEADKKAELLLEHYQDTFQHLLYHWRTRNRLFAFILVLLALMALDCCSPGVLAGLMNAYIHKKTAAAAQTPYHLNFAALGTLVWFALLCMVVQYYQRSILVDRQYCYLNNLEQQLCDLMGGPYITREGRAYYSRTGVYQQPPASAAEGEAASEERDERPRFLKAVGPVYTNIFPFFLTLFVAIKLVQEGFPPTTWSGKLNFLICLAIVGFNGYYLSWVWRRR